MDERYYIIGGVALLLLALVVYLFIAVARYRRAVRNAHQAVAPRESEGEERYLADDDRASLAFATTSAQASDADSAQTASGLTAEADPIVDLYRSLEEAPEFVPEFAQVSQPAPPAEEPLLLEEPSHPVFAPEPEPVPEPQADEIAELMAALGTMGALQPEPAAELEIEPTPEAEWQPTFEAVFEPTYAPGPPPAPVAEQQPGYFLADELERLMTAAESQSVFLPPEAHEETLAPIPVPESPPVYEAPPLLPSLSVGQALSASVLAFEPAPTPAFARTPAPAAEPPATTPAYALVAPVELQFTGGGGRVGVKPGTRSYAEFQRLAGIMLGDLQAARGR